MLHPSDPRNKTVPRIRVSSVLWGQAERGRGAPSLGGRGGRRERGGPHDTICPDLQSSHTHTQPSPEPLADARPSPSVARTHTHRGAQTPLARTDPTHTLARRPPRTLLRRTHTRTVPARPPQLPLSPQSLETSAVARKGVNFLQRGRQGSHSEGGQARRPWAGLAPHSPGSRLPSLSPTPLTW